MSLYRFSERKVSGTLADTQKQKWTYDAAKDVITHHKAPAKGSPYNEKYEYVRFSDVKFKEQPATIKIQGAPGVNFNM